MDPTPRSTAWAEKNRERFNTRQREWRKANPEKVKEYSRRSYVKHQAKRKTYRDGRKEVKKEYDRWFHLEKEFGLTKEQFQEMWDRQKGQCPICLDPLPDSPHVDHDHDTNRVRGLTCGSCNRFVLAKPDIEKFKRAIRYLGGEVNES